MATMPSNEGSKFKVHPEGRFLGVLADVYDVERLNNFYGKPNDRGEADNRKVTQSVYFVFLTEYLTKDGRPSMVRQEFSFSYGENSKLKRALLSWRPDLKNVNLWRFDLDTLIGTGADLSIGIKPSKQPGKDGFAQADLIAPLRATDKAMAIPSDFKRADKAIIQQKEDERTKARFPDWVVRTAIPDAPAAQTQGYSREDFTAGLREPDPKYVRPFKAEPTDDDLPFG